MTDNQLTPNPQSLTTHLTAHHLRFTLKVETPIELNPHQGSALRGMLFNALRGPRNNPALGFCTQRHLNTCAECALVAACPVASLVATMNPGADRGRDVPRPYAIVPPQNDKTRYEAGEDFSFGLTLFGNALNLFPYVVMALRQAGPMGLGKRLLRPEAKARYLRGRFVLQSARAINLLNGEVQDVLQPNSPLVQQPDLPVTHAQVVEVSHRLLNLKGETTGSGKQEAGTFNYPLPATGYPLSASGLQPANITVHFKTPTRLVSDKTLLKEPQFTPLFHRLLDRLLALSQAFGSEVEAHERALQRKNELLALSDQMALIDDQTRWQEVWSYSARKQRHLPISGLVGQATYRAPGEVWAALLPYLLWGSVIHVGKNAVKGDGLIAVSR